MPSDPASRRALLERILAAGGRRRRRWLLGPSILAVLSVLSVVTLTGDDADRVSVKTDQSTSTAPPTTEPTNATPTSIADESASTTTVADAPATTKPPVCRNSYDARCGPFYWDYDPKTFPNAPLELSMTSSPETPVAGQEVTFSIRFHDPDAPWADNCARATFPGSTGAGNDSGGGYSGPDGEYSFPCAMPSCAIGPKPYGPWDPPPPPVSEPHSHSLTRVYDQSGDYTATIDAHTGFSGCGEFEGYHSKATLTVTVHVDPAPLL